MVVVYRCVVRHLRWTGESLRVSGQAFAAGLQSATLVWLTRGWKTGRLAGETAHSEEAGQIG